MSTENAAQVLDPDAPEDQDVRVLVPDGAADDAADPDDAIAPAPAKAEPVTPVAGLEDLQRQIADKTREAEQAKASERAARAQAAENARIANEAMARGISVQEMLISTQLDAAQKEVETLTAAYEQSLISGDYKETAKVNAQLARATARADRLDFDKTSFAERREQAQQQQQQQQAPADPVEATLSSLSAASQAWLREHPDLVKPTGGVKGKLIDAHEAAVAAGCAADSPAYFTHVEKELGLSNGETAEPSAEPRLAPAPAPRRTVAPSMAAPVSRAAPLNNRPSATTITLKPRHREAAAIAGVTEAEYAAQLSRMIKDGELPASALD